MSHNDSFHADAFESGTLIKLDIFYEYLRQCIPVFIKMAQTVTFNYFDFFCGPGLDGAGKKGSPLLALDAVNEYCHSFNYLNTEFNLYYSDENKEKIENLHTNVSKYKNIENVSFDIKCGCFCDEFEKKYSLMTRGGAANFIFIDPFGFEVDISMFLRISKLCYTDFIMFIPSSFANRFKDHSTIKKYLPGLNLDSIRDSDFVHTHICEYYRSIVASKNINCYLTQFSIKKGSNVYGLIFGTGSILGLEKFLNICWQKDPKSGEANFDMYGNIPMNGQLFLLDDFYSKKMMNFKCDLERKILNKELKTNKEVYEYTLFNGFLPRHSREIINKMVKNKQLEYTVVLSYKSIVKDKKIESLKRKVK